jgi:hypothetical protein
MTQFFAANTARRTGALDRYERSIEPPSGEPTRVAVLSVKRDRSKGIRVNQSAAILERRIAVGPDERNAVSVGHGAIINAVPTRATTGRVNAQQGVSVLVFGGSEYAVCRRIGQPDVAIRE